MKLPIGVGAWGDAYRYVGPRAPDPRPIICAGKQIGLIWSAKSASVASLSWILAHLGRLGDAQKYSVWPHDYRHEVLYRDPVYQADVASVDPRKIRWARVVRDPQRRAVSSFISCIEFPYEDKALRRTIGRDPEDGLSFRDFVEHLGRIDLAGCNLHHRVQRHPIEHAVETDVIHLDRIGLSEGLRGFEASAGVDLDPAERARLHQVWAGFASGHYIRRDGVTVDASARRFRRGEQGRSWPAYQAFLSPDLVTEIARLYAVDVAAYEGLSSAAGG